MTNLEKFITKAIDGLTDEEWNKLIIAVQQYSNWYAKQCFDAVRYDAGNRELFHGSQIETLLNVQLPDHD